MISLSKNSDYLTLALFYCNLPGIIVSIFYLCVTLFSAWPVASLDYVGWAVKTILDILDACV